MYKVQLHQLSFFAFHGLYEEEKILGNQFEVSLEVIVLNPAEINSIADTINYVSLFEIVKQKMSTPVDLLENLAKDIIDEIHHFDTRIDEVKISIKKMNPPIKGIIGHVGVTLQKKFNS